ncbi:MAG: hypothetical protein WBY94_06015 [Polyangiaceae bacterium]
MKTTNSGTCLSLVSVAASIAVCACGNNDASARVPRDDAEGGDAVSAVDGASATGTSADAGDDASDAGFVVQATQLLDDMRGTAMVGPFGLTDGPGTSGEWYTYSDRTVPWSEPPIFLSDAGLLSPPDGVPFPATDDGTGPLVLGSVQSYRRVSGGGESLWGIGLGMAFIDVAPDGGDVPVNGCEAGAIFDVQADAGDSFVPLPFDATGWTGIQFWAKSLRSDFAQPVYVDVNDETTQPFGLAFDAGGCNPCNSSGLGGCGDGFQARVVFPPEWTQIRVPFDSMHPQGWSGASTAAVPDASKIYQLNFQIEAPVPPFDVAVAYVELYK